MKENQCRVFLGIPIPKYIYDELKKSLSAYEQHFSSGHWILPENAHITIRFFGDVACENLEKLWKKIENKIQDNQNSFTITIEKIAPFPNENSSLMAAYIKPNPEIQHLFSLMKDISIDSNKNTEQTFIPHMTLYRNKKDHSFKLPTISVEVSSFNVTTLTLYESILINDKRIYQTLFSLIYK